MPRTAIALVLVPAWLAHTIATRLTDQTTNHSEGCPIMEEAPYKPEWVAYPEDKRSHLKLLTLSGDRQVDAPADDRTTHMVTGHGTMDLACNTHSGRIADDPLFRVLFDYTERDTKQDHRWNWGLQSLLPEVSVRSNPEGTPVSVANLLASVLLNAEDRAGVSSADVAALLRDVLARARQKKLPELLEQLEMPREASQVRALLARIKGRTEQLTLSSMRSIGRDWLSDPAASRAHTELSEPGARYGVFFTYVPRVNRRQETPVWYLGWQRQIEALPRATRIEKLRQLMRWYDEDDGIEVTGVLEQSLLSNRYYAERALLFEQERGQVHPSRLTLVMNIDLPDLGERATPAEQSEIVRQYAKDIDLRSHQRKAP